MQVKFKALHELAFLPTRGRPGDAGLDLYCIDNGDMNREHDYWEYRTGLAVEIPEGHVGLIFPRSSISNYSLTLTNCVGVVDSNFRGEILFRFKYTGEGNKRYKRHDRIGQLIVMPYPCVRPEWTETLTESNRGADGFGSSGA